MKKITVFSPATVANVSCGFDVLGFALDGLGDKMCFKKIDAKTVTISKIEGAKLPLEPHKNAAGFVAQKMLTDAKANFGIDIQITKGYKPGSGLGSSAASSAGAAYATNQLLGDVFNKVELVEYARLGEQLACGSPISDNVAAAIYGGFVLLRHNTTPLDIISIPTPNNLYATIIHPQIELKTEDARNILPESVPLKNAVTQWANVGGLISGLYTNDYSLIGRSLNDVIVEPIRKSLIPHFDNVKQKALQSGALGVGISGSGPSIFALSEGIETAKKIELAMQNCYKNTTTNYHTYVSKIANAGVQITEEN